VFVGVSQPFVFGAAITQSPHPALQAYEHVVPLQLAEPCDWSHAAPHAPQFATVFVGVSQPFVLRPDVSQSPQPALHAYEHVVPVQVADPCVWSHAAPHAPQLVIVVVGVSQPFVFVPDVSQSAQPAAHPP
jgi:hypothetical protein